MICSYISISTEAGNVLADASALLRLSDIDSIIFDFDGVLVDVSQSIMQVHNRTAERYFAMHGWYNTDLMVTDVDVELFKLAGGFNNDWDIAYAWRLFYWFKHSVTGSKDGRILYESDPSLEDYIAETAELGGGVESAESALRPLCGDADWKTIKKKCDREGLLRLFKEIYAGDMCPEIYGFDNETVKGNGLICQDMPVLFPSLIPARVSTGIATGRTAGEVYAGVRLMGWESAFLREHIISEDDGFLKPDHRILELCVARTGSKAPLYVGDTPDDLLTVTRYNEACGGMISCMVTTGLKNPGLVDIFMSQNADIIADNVNAVLMVINRQMGGNDV